MNTKDLINQALQEDIGCQDITTNSCVEANTISKAKIIAKQDGCLSGVDICAQVFAQLDGSLTVQQNKSDGQLVKMGDEIIQLAGSARSILTAERVALNFLMQLSGIASKTHQITSLLPDDSNIKIVDTRKTTPLLRRWQKQAVVHGGGYNHRSGLYDGILIKENHIRAAGGIHMAVAAAQKRCSHLSKIEIEVENLDQVKQALMAGADAIMLDNMNNENVKEAVTIIRNFEKSAHRRIIIEVSGNITKNRVVELSAYDINIISIGGLTHSFAAMDFSLLFSHNSNMD